MSFLFIQLFCVLTFTIDLCTAIQTVNKSCTFASNSYGPSKSGTCFHISKEAMTWPDAHGYCHSNQGWLLNCVYENIYHLDPNEIKSKGILSLWSGHHVKNRRLLADNFPTVQSAGTFTNFTLSNATGSSLCVLQVYNGTCKPRLTKRQAQAGDAGTECTDSYTKVFAQCDQRHFFVCMFEVKIDYTGAVQYQGSTSTIRSETLPVDFYTSAESVPFDQKDDACNRTLRNGNAFRVASDYERQMFRSYGYVAFSLGYITNETELFWLNEGDDYSCRAAIGDFSRFGQTEYTSLPCSLLLRVFCQLNKVYDDTPSPTLKITANWPGVIASGSEIQAPSTLARQFGSFSDAYASPIQKNVSIECVTSIGQLQGVTFYKNGIPVASNYGWPATGHYFNLEMQNNAYSVSSVSDIDLNQYFHCEVNNLKDGSILQSDFAFLRLTDYEIYSLHIDLMSNDMVDTLAVAMLKASLLNQWTTQTEVASAVYRETSLTSPATRSLSNGSALADLQSSLDNVVKSWRGWMIKPMLFTTSPNDDRKSLVAYLYQQVSETHTVEDMTETQLKLASRTIADLFQRGQTKLPQFNVTSVQVRSIDWCWPITLSDSITNDKYTLPKSTVGTVWKSSNTCAQDRQPLVTAECEGDKIIGLYWSQAHVNPLCDYSANNSGRTNGTYRLQALAQSNITKLNAEEVVISTRRTILELDIGRVIPEDVRYIADILQKSSDVTVKTPATVQGMLDIAASLRNFPDHVLTESQRLGNATNRILKSLDQLGGQVDLGPEQNNQRITSGGVGLEVWDLSRNDNKHIALGIKMLSGDETEDLTPESLETLFKKDEVDYDHAEVAILLQNDYIKALMSKYSGSNIRLSMNVFSDTTLFKNSVVVSNNSKQFLNSRVIAAQLLLDGQPVTNLGPNTVQTVFLPVKKVPTHLRSNLTTCAFWDFEAESGAGGWSSEGCVYNQTIDGRDVCVCDHLTNFAVLMSFYEQEHLNNENALALTIISIVGLSLSIAGLSLSILSFLLIKRVQRGRPQQTLFQLCLALLMSWVVFLAGVTQTSSHAGCIAVAVLLHYLILTSFMWMLMEGILQYLLFVKIMNTYFTHYMWKTSIPAWGLPVIPVAIVLIIDPDLYKGGNQYCWMSLPAFYYSFAIPVGLIVLTNVVIFIMVVVSLCRRKDMSKYSSNSQNQIVVNIRASFICFCVLGLSWIFGFLAIDDARVVFQYMFCVSASLQGFVIFAMMTARDKNVRAVWLSWLCFFCKRGGYSVPEGPSPKSTSSEVPKCQSSGSGSINATTVCDSADLKTSTGNS